MHSKLSVILSVLLGLLIIVAVVSFLTPAQISNVEILKKPNNELNGVYRSENPFGGVKYVEIKRDVLIMTEFFPAIYNPNQMIAVPEEKLQWRMQDGQIFAHNDREVRFIFTILPDKSIVENEGNFIYKKTN